MVDVSDSDANEFIVTELSPSTAYLCSMLAYTTLDGPRTFYLTASTFANGEFVLCLVLEYVKHEH